MQTKKKVCLKSGKTSRKTQCSEQGRKSEEETGETKERARKFFPGTIQICKEYIQSTEIRRVQDGENSSGETFKRQLLWSESTYPSGTW